MSQCNLLYDRRIPHHELYHQAQKGNIKYLRAIYRNVGYIQYDQCITQVALYRHHYDFWNEFVRLSKRTLPKGNYPWDARLQVITDLFMGYRDPDEHYLYDLFRPLYDALLLPSTAPGQDLAYELEADLCLALALHPPRRSILDYLTEQKGFRFKAQHLELAQLAFDRDLVHYVRNLLHPDCIDSVPVSLADPEPNDSDLICIILDAVRVQYHGCGYDAAVRFLLDYPVMIDKMYCLLEYLQRLQGHESTSSNDEDGEGEDSVDEFRPEEETPEPFYRQDLAQQLIAGVLEPDSVDKPFREVVNELPLEAVRPLKEPFLPNAMWSRPPSDSSTWIETRLFWLASDSPTIVEDMQMICQLVFIMADQENPGLQRWDLVDKEQGQDVAQFQPDCVPNRARFLSGRRQWFHDLRSQLVQLHRTDPNTKSTQKARYERHYKGQ